MILSPQAITVLLALAVVVNILYGLVVYARNRKHPKNRSFFVLTIAASSWGAAMYILRANFNITDETIYLFAKILFVSASAIPTTFIYLTYTLPSYKKLPFLKKYVPLLSFILLTIFVFTPNYFIANVTYDASGTPIIALTAIGRIIFGSYLIIFFGTVYTMLIRRIRKRENKPYRAQLVYILIGTSIPAVVGLFTNFILPATGHSSYNWLGPSSVVASTGVILYGIVKHGLFDVRVITTEILMAILWLIAFIRIASSDSVGVALFNILAFVLLIIIGIMLIRSVTREVETREKLEVLTKQLQKANVRLKELDRQKSEFLSIATHQLRGPLAGIRGHLSLIIDGSYGKVSEKALEIIKKVFDSSGVLTGTINDFLNVSRIEQGRMQYDREHFRCNELVKEIVSELLPVAKDRKLELAFDDKCIGVCDIFADKNKLRHIFTNLIDNAIKYTEKGWVKVTVQDTAAEDFVRIKVSDSGIGIPENELEKLFEKFVRARGASGVNVNGTGLGLYVARQMVEAHNGKIWVESEGEGKGSTFIVELPTATEEEK